MAHAAQQGGRVVTVFGGSGFIGRHVVRALAKRGWRVRVAVRRPDLAGHTQPMGVVGQVVPVQANVRYPESVARAVAGADAVVNLVAVLAESGKQTFDALHVEGAAAIARACAEAGIGRVVHVSAIGADAQSDSAYARTKAAGEAAMRQSIPSAVILRPSIVFGPEDKFFNRFAGMARFSPVLPVIGDGETKFQPVFVGDVAQAVVKGVEGELGGGRVYELGGPEAKSFKALMHYVLDVTGRRRLVAPLPVPLARIQATVLERLPGQLLTNDQITSLQYDNVVSQAAINEGRTLEGMGIRPTAMEAVVPGYLWRFRRMGEFQASKSA
ncbi:MAG: complex I NDUFA9 subunit family protein [Beijerinckiaceae bacterium]